MFTLRSAISVLYAILERNLEDSGDNEQRVAPHLEFQKNIYRWQQ